MYFYLPDLDQTHFGSPLSDHFFSMRLQRGDECGITDLKGNFGVFKILNADKKTREIQIQPIQTQQGTSNYRIGTLYQALIDRSYQEKLCEVLPFTHFSNLVFVQTDLCSPQQPNFERLEGILTRSCSQCQTLWKPEIDMKIMTFSEVFQTDTAIMNSDYEEKKNQKSHSQNTCFQDNATPSVFIGPEGGWSDKELQFISQSDKPQVYYPGAVYPAWLAGLIHSTKQTKSIS